MLGVPMTPRQREAVESFKRTGNVTETARELGTNRRDVQRMLDRAGLTEDVREKYRIDPAIADSMKAAGTNMIPSLAWVKVQPTEDQPGYSVMLRPDAQPP
jgi:hypothetical protein